LFKTNFVEKNKSKRRFSVLLTTPYRTHKLSMFFNNLLFGNDL